MASFTTNLALPPSAVPSKSALVQVLQPLARVREVGPPRKAGRPFDFEERPAGRARTKGDEAAGERRRVRLGLVPAGTLVESDVRGIASPASTGFVAQVLGQYSEPVGFGAFGRHRDAPELGSHAYRRAGGEPALYSENAALIRLAV